MGIVPFDLEPIMYAFFSVDDFYVVRNSNLTIAEAINRGLVYKEPRSEVFKVRVEGLSILCLIPF